MGGGRPVRRCLIRLCNVNCKSNTSLAYGSIHRKLFGTGSYARVSFSDHLSFAVSMSVRLLVNFSNFLLRLQNHCANINLTKLGTENPWVEFPSSIEGQR